MFANRFNSSACFLLFDCPTDTPLARKQLAKFRRAAQGKAQGIIRISRGRAGYTLLHCSPSVAADLLRPLLPPDGEMRIVPVTEAQIERTAIHWGAMRKNAVDCAPCGAR